MSGVTLTGEGTHTATQRGYAGTVIEIGEVVPAGIPVSTVWMAPVEGDKPQRGRPPKDAEAA